MDVLTEERYVRVETPRSHCGVCHESLTLVQSESGAGPMFYICWPCQKVVQAGVGPVEEEVADDVALNRELTEVLRRCLPRTKEH